MDTIKLEFELDNETKNTVIFKEVPDPDHEIVIGQICVNKDELSELDWDEENIIVEIKIGE